MYFIAVYSADSSERYIARDLYGSHGLEGANTDYKIQPSSEDRHVLNFKQEEGSLYISSSKIQGKTSDHYLNRVDFLTERSEVLPDYIW